MSVYSISSQPWDRGRLAQRLPRLRRSRHGEPRTSNSTKSQIEVAESVYRGRQSFRCPLSNSMIEYASTEALIACNPFRNAHVWSHNDMNRDPHHVMSSDCDGSMPFHFIRTHTTSAVILKMLGRSRTKARQRRRRIRRDEV